jgi:hypothetical protein
MWNSKDSRILRQAMINYCNMDVQVLREVHEKFILTLCGSLSEDDQQRFCVQDVKETISATALHMYQKFFMPPGVELHGNPQTLQGLRTQRLERESYFGGYTQVFRHGRVRATAQKPIVHLDIVSMYPSILHDVKMPVGVG